MKINKLINYWPFAILIFVSLLTILPFFQPGFFPIHDNTQIQRVFEMGKALSDGMFPVRWVADLGYSYGYPIFNFYAPTPYYVGGFIKLAGIDAILATKVMIAAAIFGSSFSMYFLAKEFWGKWGGLFSAILYQFTPYHALNAYVRGDVGEVYASFFIPLIFWAIWKHYKTENFKFILIGSLSYAGLITSHNLSAMMITPFIFIIVFALFVSKRKFALFTIPMLGILLSSFYFIPALLEMKYTNVMKIIGEGSRPYLEHFVCPLQLWDSLWMYGGSAPGCIDGLSFRIGKLHVIIGILGVLGGLGLFRKERKKIWITLLPLFGLVISVFLMLSYSKPIWETVPYMKFFQYPWRFLMLVSFFSSFLGGSILFFVFQFFKNPRYKTAFVLLSLLIIVFPISIYLKLFVPQSYINKTDEDFYTNKDFLNFETSKISDEYMPKMFKTPTTKEEIYKEKVGGRSISLGTVVDRTNYYSADLVVSSDTAVLVHIPYFPAWKYFINGKEIEAVEIESGVSFPLQKGRFRFEARFQQTPVEKAANLLSLSGIGLIALGIIYGRKRNKNETLS